MQIGQLRLSSRVNYFNRKSQAHCGYGWPKTAMWKTLVACPVGPTHHSYRLTSAVGKNLEFGNVQKLTWPLGSCVALSKPLNFSGPPFWNIDCSSQGLCVAVRLWIWILAPHCLSVAFGQVSLFLASASQLPDPRVGTWDTPGPQPIIWNTGPMEFQLQNLLFCKS